MHKRKLGQFLPEPYEPYAYVDEQFLATIEALVSQDLPAVGQFVMGVDQRLKKKQYIEAAWDAVLIGAIAGYNLKKFGRDSAVAIAVALQIARHAVQKTRFRKGAGVKGFLGAMKAMGLGQTAVATTRIPYFEEAVHKPEYALTPGRARREVLAMKQASVEDKVSRAAARTRAGVHAMQAGESAEALEHFSRAFTHADELDEWFGEKRMAQTIKETIRPMMARARTMSGF
ncbi:MAG: hypothetical protein GTO22_20985 [Gemmatimonadales bacterium]|nr:hypothetical protein [Gemmatimonadales bacterium]